MRSLVSTGDECPAGRAVFQITFLPGPNSSGRFVAVETPLAFTPRNWGQSAPRSMQAVTAAIRRARRRGIESSIYRAGQDVPIYEPIYEPRMVDGARKSP